MKILLVEDNIKLAESVADGLKTAGFLVDTANNGNDGIDMILSTDYDCVILDILLPDISGFDFCDFLRHEEKSRVPIMMLTALDDVENRVKGLQLGADDYLAKPFDFREILARVRALIRRSQIVCDDILSFSELTLNTSTREVYFKNEQLKLSKREFDLLEIFLRNPGIVFSREQLIEKVWDTSFEPQSNVVDVYILYLRNKLKPFFQKNPIETLKNIGYRFTGEGRT